MKFQFGCLLLLLCALASCVGEPVLKDGSKERSIEVEKRGSGPAPLKLLGPVFEALVASREALQESVVFFCVDWMEQCEALQENFRRSARALADNFNSQRLLEPQIRLAEVNCAEDKVLCNRQQVESYPSIVRYVDGIREEAWEGSLGRKYKDNLESMQKWLRRHLGAKVQRTARQFIAPLLVDPIVQAVVAEEGKGMGRRFKTTNKKKKETAVEGEENEDEEDEDSDAAEEEREQMEGAKWPGLESLLPVHVTADFKTGK